MEKNEKSINFTSFINKLEYLLGVHYVEVNPTIIKKLGGKMNVRLICTLNKSVTFQCGLVALGKGSAYITINNKRIKELKLKNGDEVKVSLIKDESTFGMTVPEELEELLKQDPEGNKRFNKLTPGRQRYIIQYVSTVKNPNLRLERALLLITNLKKLPPGKENFRELLGLEKRPS